MARRSLAIVMLLTACGSGGHGTSDASGDGVVPAGCGDGVKGAGEDCDQQDLGGATCSSAVAPGWVGVVSCTAACRINVAGCNSPTTTWQDMTDPAGWTLFDVSSVYPGAKGFATSIFDGRYLYFSPANNGAPDGLVTRYDTQGGFGASTSWTTFDVSTIDSAAKGFNGGAFDGRYLYLVPYNNGAYDGTVARYDTQASAGFGASSSWSTFDVATVDPDATGFTRATFDGRYLYLSPHYNGVYHGTVARYDTQSPTGLASASSWTTFDVSTISAQAKGFLATVFDGRYVYFVPYYDGTTYVGLVVRYDTQSVNGFADASSWSTFDVSTVNGHATGFFGGTFDGRYIYMVQYYDNAAMAYGGWVARYDTHAAFGSAASWSTFDVSALASAARGFLGMAFDGRFVYLVPYYNAAYHGNVVRYDTESTAGFGSVMAWSTFNLATLNPNAIGYDGAGFDGRYIYLVPQNNGAPQGIVARFDAKSPAWLPRGWNASFD